MQNTLAATYDTLASLWWVLHKQIALKILNINANYVQLNNQ